MKYVAIRNGYSNQITKPRNMTLLTAVLCKFYISPLGMYCDDPPYTSHFHLIFVVSVFIHTGY